MRCFKRTKNDWCPSYGTEEDPLVQISMGKMSSYATPDEPVEQDMWHVTGEGGDDLLIQRFYDNENIAICDFMILLGKDYVNYDSFDELRGSKNCDD